jgi:hypothetical protein
MPQFLPLIASFALTAISTFITIQESKKKEKRLKSLNEERAALQKTKNTLLLDEAKRKRTADVRRRTAALNNRRGTTGQNTESASAQQGNQALQSALLGANIFSKEVGGIDENLLDNSVALNTAANTGPGLGTILATQALEGGASVLEATFEASLGQSSP